MDLEKRLRQLRKARGLTASELAARAGLPTSYVARLESGQIRDPRVSTVRKLAKVLWVTMGNMLDETYTAEPHVVERDYDKVLGVRLRGLREAEGLSVRALAKRAGVGWTTINRIELGKAVPQLRTVEKLAQALRVPLHEMIGS